MDALGLSSAGSWMDTFASAKLGVQFLRMVFKIAGLELGMVSPVQFIPIAEETGLIVPIGMWVLNTACKQSMEWQRMGLPPVCVAVNLSPRQFADPDLLAKISAVLRDTGMAPELLELEITEGMVMHNIERAIELCDAIKRLGVRVAMDDFGTGYSSLASQCFEYLLLPLLRNKHHVGLTVPSRMAQTLVLFHCEPPSLGGDGRFTMTAVKVKPW
jgi:predicted signal transduction protein with EAL and GGDEF domain